MLATENDVYNVSNLFLEIYNNFWYIRVYLEKLFVVYFVNTASFSVDIILIWTTKVSYNMSLYEFWMHIIYNSFKKEKNPLYYDLYRYIVCGVH